MSGEGSSFIGRVRNKKGVTWGSIRFDPQVTAFFVLIGYAFWPVGRVTKKNIILTPTQAQPDGSITRVIYMFL